MMNRHRIKTYFLGLLLVLVLMSCGDVDVSDTSSYGYSQPKNDYERGMLELEKEARACIKATEQGENGLEENYFYLYTMADCYHKWAISLPDKDNIKKKKLLLSSFKYAEKSFTGSNSKYITIFGEEIIVSPRIWNILTLVHDISYSYISTQNNVSEKMPILLNYFVEFTEKEKNNSKSWHLLAKYEYLLSTLHESYSFKIKNKKTK